jgi:hypothetical protein
MMQSCPFYIFIHINIRYYKYIYKRYTNMSSYVTDSDLSIPENKGALKWRILFRIQAFH